MSASENEHPTARKPSSAPKPDEPAPSQPPPRVVPRPAPPLRQPPRPAAGRSDAPRAPLGSQPDAPRIAQGSDPMDRPSYTSDPDIPPPSARRHDPNAVTRMAPESSLEIPPPSEVPSERAPGMKDPYIGTTFDHRYKIERLLGEGGMGFVYLARHKVIDKRVAVKVLRAELAKDEEIFERFVQEARAASSVGNPHIVDVSDFGEIPDGSKYFVMEYLEGVSLSQIIDGPNEIPFDLIYKVGLQMADGLAAAHNGGVVHRDLKPDNVYVVHRGNDTEFVKILDFGIAKVTTESDSKLTQAGAVFGTPHYMSPEQAAGAPIDHRTDIYSMGVMLYELVCRQLPFTSENFMGILTQHMYKAPVPPRALVTGPGPTCPPSLEAIILKCLSKKPEARYQSMEELREDLDTARSGGIPKAVPEMMARSGGFNVPQDYFKPRAQAPVGQQPSSPSLPPPSPSPLRRVPPYAWLVGAAAAVGIAVAIAVSSGGSTPTVPATPPSAAPAAALPPEVTTNAALPTPPVAPSTPPSAEQPTALAPKRTAVKLTAWPEAAKAYVEGRPIQLPASIEVQEGKPITVEIRADGFVSQLIQLDGAEKTRSVKLAKEATKPVSSKAGPTHDPTIRDPWANKNKK